MQHPLPKEVGCTHARLTVLYAEHYSETQDYPNLAMWCQTILRNKNRAGFYRTHSSVKACSSLRVQHGNKIRCFRLSVRICLDSVSHQIALAEVLSKVHYIYLTRIPFIP